MQLPEADWITVKDAGALLKVTGRRIIALIKSGRLNATRIGERVLMLRRDEVVAFSKIEAPQPAAPRRTRPRRRR